MVGQVVAGEGIDEIDVAGDVGEGDGDDLAVAGRPCGRSGASEQVGRIGREQRGGDQRGHVIADVGRFDDRRHRGPIADRELVDQVVGIGGLKVMSVTAASLNSVDSNAGW